jgi:hypothetical protein
MQPILAIARIDHAIDARLPTGLAGGKSLPDQKF